MLQPASQFLPLSRSGDRSAVLQRLSVDQALSCNPTTDPTVDSIVDSDADSTVDPTATVVLPRTH